VTPKQMIHKLPIEIQCNCFSFLDIKSILTVLATSKHFYQLIHSSAQIARTILKDPNHEKNRKLTWKQDFNHRYYFPIDSFANISQVPPNEIFFAQDKYKQSEVFNEILPMNSIDIFYHLFSSYSKMEFNCHEGRGETDIIITPWKNASNGVGKTRDITFISPVNNPMGPKTTRVMNQQRLIFFNDARSYLIQILTKTLDVPYGDTFCLQINMIVTDNEDDTSTLNIQVGVIFLKSSLLRWKIEDLALKEVIRSWQEWAQQAKLALFDAKEKKLLYSDSKLSHILKEKKKYQQHVKKIKKKVENHVTKKKTKRVSQEVPNQDKISVPTSTPRPILISTAIPTVVNIPPMRVEDMSWYSRLLSRLAHCLDTICVPVWVLILFITFCFILFFQQQSITQNVKQIEQSLHDLKFENLLMEQQLSDKHQHSNLF
jgi:hypothetical protein